MKLYLLLFISLSYYESSTAQTFQVADQVNDLEPFAASQMRNSLTAMLAKLNLPMPGGVLCPNCLISTFTEQNVKPYQGKVDRSQLENVLKQQQLPQVAIDKIKAITFSESLAFQAFQSTVDVNARQGILLEIVGAARRQDNTVEFGILQTNLRAAMIPKYNQVNQRKCKRILFIKKCKNHVVNVLRGYTAPELSNIEKMMLYQSNVLMKSKVGVINVYSVEHITDEINSQLQQEDSPYKLATDSKQKLKEKVKDFVDRFPYLKELLTEEEKTTNTTVIKKITNRGFMTFSRSATLQAIDNVDPQMYDQFVQYAIQILGIPDDISKTIKQKVFDLVPMAENSDWILYRILFQEEEGGKCKYVCVLGHNNLGSGYDFVFATFGMKFELAPDILVIQESKSAAWGMVGSSKTIIKEVPASIKQQDIETLFAFFDLAAFTRFAKMLNVAIPSSYNQIYSEEPQAVEAATAIAAVKAGVELWGQISKAFKTTKTSKLVDTITGEGFSKFFMNSVAHRIMGLDPQFLSRYINMVPNMYGIPDKYKEEIKNILILAQFSSGQIWNKHDMLFDVNQGGNNRWMTFLSNRDSSGKYNFLVVNIEQKFDLAPDVLVIEESKSVAGGIYESTKTKFKKRPRNLTDKDLKQLFAFFTVVTFQRFAASIGMKIPDDPDISQ